jgi:hypothetical protein
LPVELSRDRPQSAEFPAGETRRSIRFSVAPIAAFDSQTDPLGDAFRLRISRMEIIQFAQNYRKIACRAGIV